MEGISFMTISAGGQLEEMEPDAEMAAADEEVVADEQAPASGKKRRASVASHDIRTFFDGSRPAPAPAPAPGGDDLQDTAPAAEGGVLAAFKLARSVVQDIPADSLTAMEGGRSEFAAPAPLADVGMTVPLLVAEAPLLPSGKAIFGQLPEEWMDVTGRSDALGTRCFFASRRHEHSIFEPLSPEQMLRVPRAASEWQPALQVPSGLAEASLADEDPWRVQLHPGRRELRILLRPGVLLQRMLRRGSALPAAQFTWRVVDASSGGGADAAAPAVAATGERPDTATTIGEFSILSNVEDAAHTQPPHFAEWPLRREQLRSLGWMASQEQRRREPFVTELRESVACPDAPHWRLEGCLRCEYRGVKGGVLADAIGYGKTACTIGLVDCTLKYPLPRVPSAYRGFIPSRATLVLVPTNLHAQWIAEIAKFTGKTFKVLSVQTCAQLKSLAVRDLVEADVVVATYRLFYSKPYLRRLQEVSGRQAPFPPLPGGQAAGAAGGSSRAPPKRTTAEWARAYRSAFEALAVWARQQPDAAAAAAAGGFDPVTPCKGPEDETSAAVPGEDLLSTQKVSRETPAARRRASTEEDEELGPSTQGKRRRLMRKQAYAGSEAASQLEKEDSKAAAKLREMEDDAEPTRFVPLEAFWWRRVVCDEFHELLSRYPPAQVAVELFHADYKWGLSGTPPCQTLAKIRKAAGFLGVQLPTATAEESGGEAPRRVAQEWLDAFMRRNTSELPALDEEERIVPVRQTPKERALYLALTEHHQIVASAAETQFGEEGKKDEQETLHALEDLPEVQAARRSASGLLKLCSHFCMSGTGDVVTAEDECNRQLALRGDRVRAAEKEAKTLAERASSTANLIRHFEPHFAGCPTVRADYGHILKEPRSGVAARLRFLGMSMVGTKAELLDKLLGAAPGGELGGAVAEASPVMRDLALRPDFDLKGARKAAKLQGKPPSAWAELVEAAAESEPVSAPSTGEELVLQAVRSALEACPAASSGTSAPARCARLRSHLGMPRWAGPAEKADPELEEENWEWLRDQGNAEKLRTVLGAWKADVENCAAQLVALKQESGTRLKSLKSLKHNLDQSQVPAEDVAMEPVHGFAKYGSKIEALVLHAQKLRRDDPTCKVICFVQWEDLKRKIGAALEEFGVEHLSLKGSVWARRAALTRFQYEESSPRMLLLSLEESASGTNLTAANHVIIVHPMEAATKEEAVAFEMQAVGRVRRPGQQRRIFIWRFVTIDTIEQKITEEHQQELWERQRAKITVSQPAPLGEDTDDGEELEDHPVGADDGDFATQRYLGGGGGGGQGVDKMKIEELEEPGLLELETLPAMPDGLATQVY